MIKTKNPLKYHIIKYIKKRKYNVFLILFLVSLAKICSLSTPFALKYIVDTTTAQPPSDEIMLVVIALVIFYVIAFFLTTLFDELKSVAAEITIQPLIANIGNNVFSQLISQPHELLIKKSFGETIKDIDRGLKSLQSMIALSIHTIIPLSIELIFIIVFTMVFYDLYYGLILITGIILHIYFTLTSVNNIAESRKKLNKYDSELFGNLTESINNLETIKIFKAEKFETQRFTKKFHEYTREAIKFQLTYSKIRITQQAIICGILLMIMLRAGFNLANGHISSGDFVLINAMAMQILIPIIFVGTIWRDFAQFTVDVKAFSHLINLNVTKAIIKQKSTTLKEVSVKLSNVNYTYSGNESTLKNISIDVPKGSFIGIVGSSGSGKSTILKLMAGLIKPDNGKILVNGEELDSNSIKSFEESMAMVPQNVVLFHGSIADNIKYSSRRSTDEDIINASKSAQLHKRVSNFPQGYNTSVGERGLRLSGGERQLIGMARAFIKEPKIIFLDEPSSALDPETEAKWIEDSLMSTKEITRVVVTHRLNTISRADNIYVIESGCVMESGTHIELIKINGLYANLWNSQQTFNSN